MRVRFARRSKQTRRSCHSTHHRVRAEARSTVTHESESFPAPMGPQVRRPTGRAMETGTGPLDS
eukprot:scaffold38504_cov111-Phaeocystis_antarctica.AAC.1